MPFSTRASAWRSDSESRPKVARDMVPSGIRLPGVHLTHMGQRRLQQVVASAYIFRGFEVFIGYWRKQRRFENGSWNLI